MGNPLQDLNGLGRSVWLDSIKRSYLGQGNYLDRLIGAHEVSGLTSNPSIFNMALDSDSDEYAEQLVAVGQRPAAERAVGADAVGRAGSVRPVPAAV